MKETRNYAQVVTLVASSAKEKDKKAIYSPTQHLLIYEEAGAVKVVKDFRERGKLDKPPKEIARPDILIPDEVLSELNFLADKGPCETLSQSIINFYKRHVKEGAKR